MGVVETVLVLLLAIAGLALLAHKWEIPYPILLVVGGLFFAVIPGLPHVVLDPKLVFLFFLPPLLYPAALSTSWRDFRANLRPITMLAIGLVLFTTAGVGWLAHVLTGMPLAAGFVLGAIVSPPDAVAATAITERLRVPQRIVTIIEGESLVNDATALVALRFASAAVTTGVFSWWHAGAEFFLAGGGGILFGLAIGWLAVQVQSRLDDPPVQTTLSLLTPYAAYLPADHLGLSGVLAVVSVGIYVGWRAPEIIHARTRLQVVPFWDMIVFLLNGLVFILIGLQLPEVMGRLTGKLGWGLLADSFWICGAVVALRLLWVFPVTYLPRLLNRKIREADPYPQWQSVLIVGWTGMRGVVSLAAALSLPLTLADEQTAFPGRDLILFLTFSVILATLVVQGLSLPPLIRWLKVTDDHGHEREERHARLQANYAALARLKEITGISDQDALHRLREEYQDRIHQLEVCIPENSDLRPTLHTREYQNLLSETLAAERRAIIRLRNERVINDIVLRRIQKDLDFAEERLGGEAD